MSLLHPRSNVPFVPSPRFILGAFDIYDREETLGVLLDQSDPNDPKELERLLDLHFFPCFTDERGYTAEHRSALAASIKEALADPNFDFQALLQPTPGDLEFSLPANWRLLDPRRLLVHAHEILLKRWDCKQPHCGGR